MEIDLTLAATLCDIQRRFLGLQGDPGAVEDILTDVAQLVDADAAMAAWINKEAPSVVTWNAGPKIKFYILRTFAGMDRDGNIRSTDPDLDSINLTRRRMGSGVYQDSAFASRATIENSAYHREAFRPAGMNHILSMTTRLAMGEAVFAMGYASGDAPALIEGRAEVMLNLLLPAFARTFGALDQQARNFERLQRAIAESDMEVSVCDENPVSIDSSGACLNLPLPEPAKGNLVISPPDTATLAERLKAAYGLTKRQKDIALCLLDGLSTRDAAAQMGISPNTARRHCEAVLNRTSAHRRGELNRIARTLSRQPPAK